MSAPGVKALVRFVSDDLFLGITPSGHAMALDTDSQRSSAPSPVELLLVALGACTATDVASILKKKRQHVTSYTIEISGQLHVDESASHPHGQIDFPGRSGASHRTLRNEILQRCRNAAPDGRNPI